MTSSLTAKLQRTALQSSNERLESTGFKPFLLSIAMGAIVGIKVGMKSIPTCLYQQ